MFLLLENLIQMKAYRCALRIVQFIGVQQSENGRKLICNDLMKQLLRRILKSALCQKEPDFDGKHFLCFAHFRC